MTNYFNESIIGYIVLKVCILQNITVLQMTWGASAQIHKHTNLYLIKHIILRLWLKNHHTQFIIIQVT